MPSPPKYLLICPAYPPPFVGGSKVWTYNMVDNCPEGFDILTSALKPGYAEVCSPRHRIIRSRYLWDSNTHNPTLFELVLSYLYIAVWLVKRLLTVRYEVVVAGAFVFANGLIFMLCRLFRVPCIGLGNAEEFTLELKGKGWKSAIKRPWMIHTHRLADGFVVVCRFCQDVLVEMGLDPRRIEIVPSSINPQKLRPFRTKREPGCRVLSVGRLVERKGFHCLIEAVHRLRDELPAITATIVGNGPYKPLLLEQVARLGLAGRVAIKDAVEDEELSRLYQESDLFVLAHMMLDNGDTEGCPTVFSEASGCGLPVIGGTGGGADTVIVDEVTGYIVNSRNIGELADRMKAILTNPALAEAMGKAGVEKIRTEHNPVTTSLAFHRFLQRMGASVNASAVTPRTELS